MQLVEEAVAGLFVCVVVVVAPLPEPEVPEPAPDPLPELDDEAGVVVPVELEVDGPVLV
ncbi:MAG: hypothetical protein WA777_10755 [Rhodanobacter sp.]